MTDDGMTATSVARLAVRGAASLGIRQVALAVITTLGSVLLARYLTPAEYGVYGIVGLLLSFLLVFGDAGLGASLVRQPEEPTTHELRQVFTLQLFLVGALVSALAVAASHLTALFSLPGSDALVFRLAAGAVLVQTLQVVPVLRLERALSFGRIGFISVVEVIVFNVVSVALAAAGVGASSVGYGLLLQAITGAMLASTLSPWPIGVTRELGGMGERLRFSLLYQGSNVISLLKDSVTPVLIGLTSGAAAVGYVSWAHGLAAVALLGLAPLARLYLPVYSRLLDDRDRLGRAVEASMRVTNSLTAPVAVLLVVLAEPLTHVVYGDKWKPGLTVFLLLSVANLVVPAAQPLFSMLNAVGRTGTTFRLSVMWMALTWALTPPLILVYGLRGFGIANLLVQVSTLVLFHAARREAPFSLLRPFWPAWTAATVAGAAVWLLRLAYPDRTTTALLTCTALGVALYIGLTVVLQRSHVQFALALLRPA